MLGSTLERVALPDDLVARLEGKSSLGRLGLLIHSTAGFVDAGWDGHLTLELSNVANLPIAIYPGMKIGQISFLRMTTPADAPLRQRRHRLEVPGPAGPDAVPLLPELPRRGWRREPAARARPSNLPNRHPAGGSRMRRLAVVVAVAVGTVLATGSAACACGSLVGPNGAVQLVRTSTLAAYHDGVEHYVTNFEFASDQTSFGSIIPLPAEPTKVERGGDWTLQRLQREVAPAGAEAPRPVWRRPARAGA